MGDSLLSDPHIWYVARNYLQEWLLHPFMMMGEHGRFFRRWPLGFRAPVPKGGACFEQHSHSHFSDGAELAFIVDKLFDLGIQYWSLTDHGNSKGFDSLRDGSYRLQEHSAARRKYEIEPGEDRRYLVIHADGKKLTMLRSVEYRTSQGEIGLHGIEEDMPKEKVSVREAIATAFSLGGYAVIHHAFFWEGIGYHGMKAIEEAADATVRAIELNATEIPPQVYSVVRSRWAAKKFGLRMVPAGDAHTLDMYGLSGLMFDPLAERRLQLIYPHPAARIEKMIIDGSFTPYFNYLTLGEFKEFWSSGAKKG